MSNSPSPHSFRLPVTPAAASIARKRVAEACAGLDEEQRHDAELLVSEIVTNAVRHPPPAGDAPAAAIEVSIHSTLRGVRVEVCDHDPRPLPPAREPGEPRESGWGLYLVSHLATKWGTRQPDTGAGKVVWFEIGQPAG